MHRFFCIENALSYFNAVVEKKHDENYFKSLHSIFDFKLCCF
jgi:hypothetical protein